MPLLIVTIVFAALTSRPAYLHGQQPSADQHDQHQTAAAAAEPATPAPAPPHAGMPDMMAMMDQMKASEAKLDALVAQMNAAKGDARIDAMGKLLTALVDDRRACEPMMQHMMSMMGMMGGHGGMEMPAPGK
jgi:hypothetical protein